MSGVTHSRAILDDEPVIFGADWNADLEDEQRAARLARHAEMIKERAIYTEGLARPRIKKADRMDWEKRVRALTLELLKIETELGL